MYEHVFIVEFKIPAGTKVSATIVDPMRSEKHFQNADQFIPGKYYILTRLIPNG